MLAPQRNDISISALWLFPSRLPTPGIRPSTHEFLSNDQLGGELAAAPIPRFSADLSGRRFGRHSGTRQDRLIKGVWGIHLTGPTQVTALHVASWPRTHQCRVGQLLLLAKCGDAAVTCGFRTTRSCARSVRQTGATMPFSLVRSDGYP